VKALSGGERNRLLLARLFTRPANVFVLDEPTNDLDIETLDLLEEQLVESPATLFLVSHDRVFLDHVVTSTFVFEGEGRVQEFVGGYQDWIRQRRAPPAREPAAEPPPEGRPLPQERGAPAAVASRKLSYKEQREREALPTRIEALEAEERELNARIAGPEFYREGAQAITDTLACLEALKLELTAAYTRWDELESRSSA
jgi:ATP-binding cassette subfamily F protein uup